MNEIELLDSIKSNPDNFSELFKLYYKPIFGYILRRTGDIDHTADIAADTFLKAFKHIGKFSYKGISIKVWLYRIATNEVNLYFRQQQKKHSLFVWMDADNRDRFNTYFIYDKMELEHEMKKHQQFLSIQISLKTLPEKYQEVIALRYFEGKENREIAEILNVKEGTIKSLLSRGLEKLKKNATNYKHLHY